MAEQTSTPRDPLKRLEAWFEHHRRAVLAGVAAIVVVGGGTWFYMSAEQRKENFSRSALEDARSAAQAGNLALAASDLGRLIDSYAGTKAADEGVILLAQIRLLQDDPAAAAQLLREAIARGVSDEFRAPAYGMLGVALEELGNFTDAAEAYGSAAHASWYEFLAAQYLIDAGRAFGAAGDTTRAVEVYQRILDRYEDAPSAVEARVRLAELTAPRSAIEG